jgi:formylglycine-generating enzyme required for sulfatase activity
VIRHFRLPPGPRVVYNRTGEFDQATGVAVEPDGAYRSENNSFVTNGFREGRLTRAERRELARLVGALSPPGRFGFYDRASGVSELTVDERLWMWRHYAPTPEVEALVRFLNGR